MCYKILFAYLSLLLFDCSGQKTLNIRPFPTSTVTEKGSVTFTCTYSNNRDSCLSQALFQWFLNNKQTLLLSWTNNECVFGDGNAALNYTCGIAQNICEITLTLTLTQVQRSQHRDVWGCRIDNMQQDSRIVVNVPITSVNVTSPTSSPVTVSENSPSRFVCETSAGRPQATITWYKQAGTNEAIPLQAGTIHFDTAGITRSTLQFTPTRSDHDYKVYCTAYNVDVSSKYTSTNKPKLYVQYSPVIQPIQDRDVVLASPLTATCVTTAGNPPQTSYRWTRSESSSWSQIGQTLSISRVEKTDAGDYTCTAWNVMTPTEGTKVNGEVSTNFTLNILSCKEYETSANSSDSDQREFSKQDKASITSFKISEESADGSYTVAENSRQTFQCEVDSNPASDIQITRVDGTVLAYKNNTLSVTFETTLGCHDAGKYACNGHNNYNGEVKPSKQLELFVRCHPRAAELNITVYKALHESVILNSSITAYPSPTYTWFKAENGGWVRLSSEERQAHLTIEKLQEDDFRQYKANVTNGITPDLVIYYVIEANGKPEAPFNFTVFSDHITHSSALVQWSPGFSGGPPQVFYIEYKKKEDQPWTTIAAVGETAINKTITSLVPNTQYVVRMYANNSVGKSNTTETLEIKTLAAEETPTSNLPLIAGLSGSGVAVIVIVVLAIVIVVRKRNTPKRKSSKAKKGEENEVFVPEIGDCTYSEVNKFRTAPPTNSNVKAGGNTEDLYATSSKAKGNANKISEDRDGENNTGVRDRKAVSKAPEREKKTKGGKKKNGDKGKGKATRGEVYENAAMNFLNEDQYANSPAVKETQIYEDVGGSAPQQPQRQANQEGLIYLDLDFQKDPMKATGNKIIGIEDKTEYGVIDFNKKNNPLPDSDKEDKNAT